jgi:putative solute:sodium symporter small subunit
MSHSPDATPPPETEILKQSYWRKNLCLMGALLIIWAIAGLGCGVLWADYLNQWKLFGTGYPLGFWFAQQGSIIVFVLVILIYALGMNRLDRNHRQAMKAASEKEVAS